MYPTKQQTGAELFQLVHTAANSFPRVALYFEASIARHDLTLLASAAAAVDRAVFANGKLVVESRRGVGVPWTGPATVDGKRWPVASDSVIWLLPGAHVIESSAPAPGAMRVLDFNGNLKMAGVTASGIEFAYQSSARAMAHLDRVPAKLQIDGVERSPEMSGNVLLLPRGQHFVTLTYGKTSTVN